MNFSCSILSLPIY